jgi:uncharacterized protein (TIGR02118 family)
MYKVVTLIKRRRGLAVEDFQARWHRVHGPLVAAGPEVRRYVQSQALLQGYAKGELIFDGIAEAWFDSAEAHEAFERSSAATAIAVVEEELLDRSRTVVMPVDVHVIKDERVPGNAVKNIEFVNRRPGMALEPFRAYWREVHGPIASRILVLRRYEQNHLKREAYAAQPKPRYDGLAITWFESTADMKRGALSAEYAATRADEPNFLPDGHLPIIITREHVLAG